MLKKIRNDFTAALFKLLRLILAITLWSCHVWVAPAVRLCQGLAATIFGFRDLRKGRTKIAAAILQAKAFCNLSLRGVKRFRGESTANPEIPHCMLNKFSNPIRDEMATPGFAITYQESDCIRLRHSKLFQLRSKATRIASIPRIWRQGIKQPSEQGETSSSELRTIKDSLSSNSSGS